MRVVNGALGAAGTLLTLAAGMYVIQFTARAWAGRRLAEKEHDLNAEALLLGL